MKVLIPITIYCIVMAYLSERRSICKIDEHGEISYAFKDGKFWFLLAAGMGIFCGLRLRGNDTGTYRGIYLSLSNQLSAITRIDWTNLSGAPGLTFICIILRWLKASAQDYLMLFAIFTIGTYLWFIRKYAVNLWLSAYFFLTMGVYTFAFAAIKQTVCVAILLIATDRAIQKKWVQYALFMVIAELFHPYAFIYFVIPFLFFPPWSNRTYYLLIGTSVVAIGLQSLLDNIFTLTETLGFDYDANAFSMDGVNTFRVLVVWAPIILSFLAKGQLKCTTNRVEQLVINGAMINAMVMFIGLFGTANYFARLANYFLIFQVLALPCIIRIFNYKSQRLLKTACVPLYFAYYYYASAIAQGGFDRSYAFMSLFDYIKQLL